MSTFQGTGTTFYGKAQRIGDTFVTTEWLVLFMFPIIPLRSLRVRLTEDVSSGWFYHQRQRRYQILGGVPIRSNLRQVLLTWQWTFAIFVWPYVVFVLIGIARLIYLNLSVAAH